MATSTTPKSSSTKAEQRAKVMHYLALGGIFVCPIIILLPPRKLDIYTFALIGGTAFGANHLTHEYTGRSITRHWGDTLTATFTTGQLPAKAQATQARIKAEKRARYEDSLKGKYVDVDEEERESKVLKALERLKEEEKQSKETVLRKVWMGAEGADWKKKRDEREKKALEEGKGIGDLIMAQIWEVWNWGQDKAGEVKEKDERVVAAKKEGKK